MITTLCSADKPHRMIIQQLTHTSKKKSVVSTWKSGLIFLTVWISFHSFATKYVLHMLTGTVALRTPPSPGKGDQVSKAFLFLSAAGSKRITAQTPTSVTFHSFKNFSFRPFPINKEYIYGNLGYELMQKLQSLKIIYNKTLKKNHHSRVILKLHILYKAKCNHKNTSYTKCTELPHPC